MDSKKMKRMLIAMVLMFMALVGVIAALNLETVKKKLGMAAQEPVQEELQRNQLALFGLQQVVRTKS